MAKGRAGRAPGRAGKQRSTAIHQEGKSSDPARLVPVHLVHGPSGQGLQIELPGSVRLSVGPHPELISSVLKEVLDRVLSSREAG